MEWYEKLMLWFFITFLVGTITTMTVIVITKESAPIYWMLTEEEEEVQK